MYLINWDNVRQVKSPSAQFTVSTYNPLSPQEHRTKRSLEQQFLDQDLRKIMTPDATQSPTSNGNHTSFDSVNLPKPVTSQLSQQRKIAIKKIDKFISEIKAQAKVKKDLSTSSENRIMAFNSTARSRSPLDSSVTSPKQFLQTTSNE